MSTSPMGQRPMPPLRFIHPAAFLVLLPAAAGTWIVSPDLRCIADDLLDLCCGFALHFAGGAGCFAGDANVSSFAEVFGDAVILRHLVLGFGDLVIAARLGRGSADPGAEDQVGDLVADPFH